MAFRRASSADFHRADGERRYPAAPDRHAAHRAGRCGAGARRWRYSAPPHPPWDGQSGCDSRPGKITSRAPTAATNAGVDEVRLPWCGAVITSAASRLPWRPAWPAPRRPRCRSQQHGRPPLATRSTQLRSLDLRDSGSAPGMQHLETHAVPLPGIAVDARFMAHRLRRQRMLEGQRGLQHCHRQARPAPRLRRLRGPCRHG
jgi:hypothetical protein